MSWKLIDPLNNQFEGEISELTLAEAKLIKGRWFKWAKYMQLPEKQHVQVFKLTRVGYPDILGIIAVYYEDGVVVDSLEIEPQSRRMPSQQRRYVNLCDVMLAFAAFWGLSEFGDSFIGLVPKSGLAAHYEQKYDAWHLNRGMYGIAQTVTTSLIRLYYY